MLKEEITKFSSKFKIELHEIKKVKEFLYANNIKIELITTIIYDIIEQSLKDVMNSAKQNGGFEGDPEPIKAKKALTSIDTLIKFFYHTFGNKKHGKTTLYQVKIFVQKSDLN